MSCCSIQWCNKNSKTSKYKTDGITFHRFPKKPEFKEKWINCTKRENWFPSNYSVICSRHFTEDCFYSMKNRRRLFNTAIPTLYLPVLSNVTVPTECAQEDASPKPSLLSHDPARSTTPRGTKRKVNDPETPSQFEALTKKRLCGRVLELSGQVKCKNKRIKLLQDKVRYYKKKVASLKFIIKELQKKNLVAEEADI